jgi:hypothetical protein
MDEAYRVAAGKNHRTFVDFAVVLCESMAAAAVMDWTEWPAPAKSVVLMLLVKRIVDDAQGLVMEDRGSQMVVLASMAALLPEIMQVRKEMKHASDN